MPAVCCAVSASAAVSCEAQWLMGKRVQQSVWTDPLWAEQPSLWGWTWMRAWFARWLFGMLSLKPAHTGRTGLFNVSVSENNTFPD